MRYIYIYIHFLDFCRVFSFFFFLYCFYLDIIYVWKKKIERDLERTSENCLFFFCFFFATFQELCRSDSRLLNLLTPFRPPGDLSHRFYITTRWYTGRFARRHVNIIIIPITVYIYIYIWKSY